MTLSKLEVQQMLREMNVKFSADETHGALKQRLQREHHRLWMKSVSGGRATDSGIEKTVVRKRKKAAAGQNPINDSPSTSAKPKISAKPNHGIASHYPRNSEVTHRTLSIEKPEPGKPWKAAADGTEPFNRNKNVFDSVLRRARMCCERCGIQSDQKDGTADLEAYYLLPLSQGGEHSIKNVVALCPVCLDAMQADPDPKVVRDLKRKTRLKIHNIPMVVSKKPVRSNHPISSRRK